MRDRSHPQSCDDLLLYLSPKARTLAYALLDLSVSLCVFEEDLDCIQGCGLWSASCYSLHTTRDKDTLSLLAPCVNTPSPRGQKSETHKYTHNSCNLEEFIAIAILSDAVVLFSRYTDQLHLLYNSEVHQSWRGQEPILKCCFYATLLQVRGVAVGGAIQRWNILHPALSIMDHSVITVYAPHNLQGVKYCEPPRLAQTPRPQACNTFQHLLETF
eukprot:4046981-Amphidinium_carterae.1